jgi:hypothetical protein
MPKGAPGDGGAPPATVPWGRAGRTTRYGRTGPDPCVGRAGQVVPRRRHPRPRRMRPRPRRRGGPLGIGVRPDRRDGRYAAHGAVSGARSRPRLRRQGPGCAWDGWIATRPARRSGAFPGGVSLRWESGPGDAPAGKAPRPGRARSPSWPGDRPRRRWRSRPAGLASRPFGTSPAAPERRGHAPGPAGPYPAWPGRTPGHARCGPADPVPSPRAAPPRAAPGASACRTGTGLGPRSPRHPARPQRPWGAAWRVCRPPVTRGQYLGATRVPKIACPFRHLSVPHRRADMDSGRRHTETCRRAQPDEPSPPPAGCPIARSRPAGDATGRVPASRRGGEPGPGATFGRRSSGAIADRPKGRWTASEAEGAW